jgi:hypothetical protein
MAPRAPARGRAGAKTRTKLVVRIRQMVARVGYSRRSSIIRQAKEQNDDAITK